MCVVVSLLASLLGDSTSCVGHLRIHASLVHGGRAPGIAYRGLGTLVPRPNQRRLEVDRWPLMVNRRRLAGNRQEIPAVALLTESGGVNGVRPFGFFLRHQKDSPAGEPRLRPRGSPPSACRSAADCASSTIFCSPKLSSAACPSLVPRGPYQAPPAPLCPYVHVHPYQDSETVMCYLTAPYLRLPLVFGFFAQPQRFHTLQHVEVQELLNAVLFEPGHFRALEREVTVQQVPHPALSANASAAERKSQHTSLHLRFRVQAPGWASGWCLVFGLRDREGGGWVGGYEGKKRVCVPKMGPSFWALESKFHF